MAEQKHIEGKLEVRASVVREGDFKLYDEDGAFITAIKEDLCGEHTEAIANRLADCWNALAGISDPSAVGELVVEFEAMFEALQKVIPNARLTEPGKRAISLLSRLKGTP